MNNKRYLLFFLACLLSFACFAQDGNDTLPFRKYPTLPAFNILLTDSSTIVNTYNAPGGKPIMLIYFSPDCGHCQHLTQAILDHKKDLKGVRIYMCSMMELSAIREFEKKMELRRHKNIMVGRDYEWFFPKFYGTQYLPYIVIYDKRKRLVKAIEGVRIEDILTAIEVART